MALEKQIPDPTSTGAPISASHARLTSVNIDLFGQTITFTAGVWRSKNAFEANKQAVLFESFTIYPTASSTPLGGQVPSFADFLAANPAMFNGLRKALYDLMKTWPEYLGANDV